MPRNLFAVSPGERRRFAGHQPLDDAPFPVLQSLDFKSRRPRGLGWLAQQVVGLPAHGQGF
jgi:hypothetical protein